MLKLNLSKIDFVSKLPSSMFILDIIDIEEVCTLHHKFTIFNIIDKQLITMNIFWVSLSTYEIFYVKNLIEY